MGAQIFSRYYQEVRWREGPAWVSNARRRTFICTCALIKEVCRVIQLRRPSKPKLIEGVRDRTTISITSTPKGRVFDHVIGRSAEHPGDSVCTDGMSRLVTERSD
jgi:hypothetical protein